MLNQSESSASSESFVPRLRRHAAPVSREPGSVSSAAAAQPRAVPASPTGFGCRLLPLLCAFTVVLGMLGARLHLTTVCRFFRRARSLGRHAN